MDSFHDDTNPLVTALTKAGMILLTNAAFADLEDRAYALIAYQHALHAHGIVLIRTVTDGAVAWAVERVPPRLSLDVPDLPAPSRSLRLAVYAGLQLLKSPAPPSSDAEETTP